MSELKFRLAAEVIKFYRQDAEERALADLLLYQLGLTITEAQQLELEVLEQLVANVVTQNDDVPLPPRGKGRKTNGSTAKRKYTRKET